MTSAATHRAGDGTYVCWCGQKHKLLVGRRSDDLQPDDHEGEEQCSWCGRWLGPDSFEDGLRCKFCQEDDADE